MSLDQEPDPLRRIPTKHITSMRAEIGGILRAARLKRGQSLEAVAQQTRISKRFLEALENDKYEQFPAVVYLRGFLKGYCEHLDVNFDEIWAKLNEADAADAAAASATPAADAPASHPQSGAVKPTPASKSHAPAPKASSHAPSHAPAHDAHAAPHDAAHSVSGATPALILAALLGVGLAVWIAKGPGSSAPAAPAQPAALQPVARAVEPKLTIRLKEDAWIRVSVDGQVVYEGRAPRETAQEWKPAHRVDLRTTEPTALELNLNGQPLELPKPGADGLYRIEIP